MKRDRYDGGIQDMYALRGCVRTKPPVSKIVLKKRTKSAENEVKTYLQDAVIVGAACEGSNPNPNPNLKTAT